MTSLNGMPATKKPGRSITFTIVPLPGATTVVCSRSQRAFSSLARVVSTCACGDQHLRLGGGDLRLDLRDCRQIAFDAPGELFPDLLLGRARRGDLRGQLVDVGLRLLEIEAIAGAGRDQLGVLRDALSAPVRARPAATRTWLVAWLSCSFSCRSLDCASGSWASASREPGPLGADLRLVRRQLRLERMDLVLVRRRIDPEQHVALLHRPVVLDRHLDHPSPHLRHDRAPRT